jgi:hypothetical protein
LLERTPTRGAGLRYPLVTVSWTVVLLVMDPLVPVILSVNVPVFVLLLVVTVNVELLGVGLGLKETWDRGGRPLALRLTGPLNPLAGFTATV